VHRNHAGFAKDIHRKSQSDAISRQALDGNAISADASHKQASAAAGLSVYFRLIASGRRSIFTAILQPGIPK
jgi:hypothetical protein